MGKRKSSSSLKKKRSKNPSKVRGKKRDRNKSRKNKSKKLCRRDDSVSDSDEYSTSSASFSSSSSEDVYRRRRARRSRSRTRRIVKEKRRRPLTSSSSPDSSSPDSIRHRKIKGLKRRGRSDVRTKINRKRPRRASVSSTSSDSRSCSTCRKTESSESDCDIPRGRSERKGLDRKSDEKVNTGNERRGYRSRSSSSWSQDRNAGDYHCEEIEGWMDKSNSRRLRSVIAFVREPDERDEGKEEMVYDHDDYPCKSGDSNDGTTKRELVHHTDVAPEKERTGENVSEIEAHAEVGERDGSIGTQKEGSHHSLDVVGVDNRSENHELEASVAIGSPKTDDLELILRQKALENLRKFRGGVQACAQTSTEQKCTSESDVKFSTSKAESIQHKASKVDAANGAVEAASAGDHVTILRTNVANSTYSLQKDHEVLVRHNLVRSKQDIVTTADHAAVSCNSNERPNTDVITNNREHVKPAVSQKSSGPHSTLKQAITSHISPNVWVNKTSARDNLLKTTETVADSSQSQDAEAKMVHNSRGPEPSSSLKLAQKESDIKEQQPETKEGSQLEQKTMSVMRGGELVQVSYKVYIPKKPPALARRQLQR